MHRRLGARLSLGGLLGAMAGVAIGALIGLLFFDRSAAIIMSILASAIFGLGAGMLVAGYSSLESPDAGAEPSDTARHVADRPEAVRKEQARRYPARCSRTEPPRAHRPPVVDGQHGPSGSITATLPRTGDRAARRASIWAPYLSAGRRRILARPNPKAVRGSSSPMAPTPRLH